MMEKVGIIAEGITPEFNDKTTNLPIIKNKEGCCAYCRPYNEKRARDLEKCVAQMLSDKVKTKVTR